MDCAGTRFFSEKWPCFNFDSISKIETLRIRNRTFYNLINLKNNEFSFSVIFSFIFILRRVFQFELTPISELRNLIYYKNRSKTCGKNIDYHSNVRFCVQFEPLGPPTFGFQDSPLLQTVYFLTPRTFQAPLDRSFLTEAILDKNRKFCENAIFESKLAFFRL